MTNGTADTMPRAAGLGSLGLFAGGLRSLRERRALKAARKSADLELLESPSPSLRLSWRAAELVVPAQRLELARTLRRLVHDADPRYLPSAQIYDRLAVRSLAAELLEVANRLSDLERPVTPRGVLLVEHMLANVSGPLYGRGRQEELAKAINTATEALEAR